MLKYADISSVSLAAVPEATAHSFRGTGFLDNFYQSKSDFDHCRSTGCIFTTLSIDLSP